MNKSHFLLLVTAGFVLSILFQSCGNVDIVKRRYRPGFHVDISKKQKQQRNTASLENTEVEVAVVEVKHPQVESRQESGEMEMPEAFTASVGKQEVATNVKQQRQLVATDLKEAMIHPFREVRQEKLNSELRRAVFKDVEDEKYGWSVVSIISIALGAVGLGLVIAGIVLLVSFLAFGGIAFWWIFALAGLILGIAGMVTGIIGLRQTRRGGKRGRGFALAGMISGIMSLALGLIGLFWGLILTIIQRSNE